MKRSLIISGFFIVSSFASPVMADYQCATESGGVVFPGSDPGDPNAAINAAVLFCENNPNSNQSQCATANTQQNCDQGSAYLNTTCFTQSNGTEYASDSVEFMSVGQAQASDRCNQDPNANGANCSQYASDNNGNPNCVAQNGAQLMVFTCTALDGNNNPYVKQSNIQYLAQVEANALCTNATGADCSNGDTTTISCDGGQPVLPPAPPAPQPLYSVQIVSIDGNYSFPSPHAQTLYVHPGQVIQLSSDLIDQNGNAIGSNVENFVWTATESLTNGQVLTETCDLSNPGSCYPLNNFQVNDYGVTFYAPYNLADSLTITVYTNNPQGLGALNSDLSVSQDNLEVRNFNYPPVYNPPVQVVYEPSQYPYQRFDNDSIVEVLGNQGHWVMIEGVQYWVPYSYIDTDNAQFEWEPYRNGSWTWDTSLGWTWVSNDPWGWATDHYGYWRHHGNYGWVWAPYDDLQYRPSGVTFFYTDDGFMGWYPYASGYDRGYQQHGFNQGFDDGYEDGREATLRNYGQAGRYHGDYYYPGGFTVVQNRNFVHGNIVEVSENKMVAGNTRVIKNVTINNTVVNVVQEPSAGSHIATYPGGENKNSSQSFVQQKIGGQSIPQTKLQTGPAGVKAPVPAQRPAVQQQIIAHMNANVGKPQAMGTVLAVSKSNSAPTPIPASLNNRATAPAPVFKTPQGQVVAVDAHTSAPSRPSPLSPAAQTQHQPPSATSQGVKPPTLDPTKPAAPPIVPKANPSQTAPQPPKGNPPASQGGKPAPLPPTPPKPPVTTTPSTTTTTTTSRPKPGTPTTTTTTTTKKPKPGTPTTTTTTTTARPKPVTPTTTTTTTTARPKPVTPTTTTTTTTARPKPVTPTTTTTTTTARPKPVTPTTTTTTTTARPKPVTPPAPPKPNPAPQPAPPKPGPKPHAAVIE